MLAGRENNKGAEEILGSFSAGKVKLGFSELLQQRAKAPLPKGWISPLAGKMSAKRTKGARARQGWLPAGQTGGYSAAIAAEMPFGH